VQQFDWRIVCGTTGSGKTRLLQALAARGAQVIDLEALANHRSSVLGGIPGLAQPTQKRFDTVIWETLRHFDSARPVFVESESKKVGNVVLPLSLVEAMRKSRCLNLVLPDVQRVALLLEDYDFFVRDVEHFCERLQVLTELRGKALVESWKASARAGDFETVVQQLLTLHYDPAYLQSMRRNFEQFETSRVISPDGYSMQAMEELAARLLPDPGQ